MRVGVDLDSALVCSDALFYEEALRQRWIPHDLAPRKSAIHDHLVRTGHEERWGELESIVNGVRLVDALPFQGARAFVQRCRRSGIDVMIVSHKPRYALSGPRIDLHQLAHSWLFHHGFLDGLRDPIDDTVVAFVGSRAEKIHRIATLNCSHFIDDRSEVLSDPQFPEDTSRILFDPHGLGPCDPRFRWSRSWSDIASELLGEQAA